jgi:hypothetical protein
MTRVVNNLETQVDCFETNEEATAFMTSLEFVENPLGVDIDPEEMIKGIESGESFESLRKRLDIRPSRSVDCAGDLKQRPGS